MRDDFIGNFSKESIQSFPCIIIWTVKPDYTNEPQNVLDLVRDFRHLKSNEYEFE